MRISQFIYAAMVFSATIALFGTFIVLMTNSGYDSGVTNDDYVNISGFTKIINESANQGDALLNSDISGADGLEVLFNAGLAILKGVTTPFRLLTELVKIAATVLGFGLIHPIFIDLFVGILTIGVVYAVISALFRQGT